LGKTSGPTQGRHSCRRQIGGMILTMSFYLTWLFVGAARQKKTKEFC
jgi:hypothetical protein